jgi:predicted transcriptional regulator of viral defense system
VLNTLLEIANEQSGYVTAAQATRLGVTASRLPRLVDSGDLRRVRWGVYAMRHVRHRLEDEISAWLSVDRRRLPWERDNKAIVVLSHSSAAALHALGTIIPTVPTLTVPTSHRSATRGAGLEVHVLPIADADWSWLRPEGAILPVTTPARTIIDLLDSDVEPSYVRRALTEVFADGRATPQELREAAHRRASRRTSLAQRVERLLESSA